MASGAPKISLPTHGKVAPSAPTMPTQRVGPKCSGSNLNAAGRTKWSIGKMFSWCISDLFWPQGSSGPQGSLGNPRKTYIYLFFYICWGIFWIFGQILRFLIRITWFLSFSSKNDAESLCHFVKIPFLDPKRAELDQNSDFHHVRTCQDLSSWTSTYCKSTEILFLKIL